MPKAMTISDDDILRSAKIMIDQHGADAKDAAIDRALELFQKGDLEGHAVWKRIADAAGWLWCGLPANDNR